MRAGNRSPPGRSFSKPGSHAHLPREGARSHRTQTAFALLVDTAKPPNNSTALQQTCELVHARSDRQAAVTFPRPFPATRGRRVIRALPPDPCRPGSPVFLGGGRTKRETRGSLGPGSETRTSRSLISEQGEGPEERLRIPFYPSSHPSPASSSEGRAPSSQPPPGPRDPPRRAPVVCTLNRGGWLLGLPCQGDVGTGLVSTAQQYLVGPRDLTLLRWVRARCHFSF